MVHDLYDNWARVYDYFYPDRSDEVAFWAQLAAPYGRQVLDLMCGTAEVSLGLARSGFRVQGIDCSAAMLAEGTRRLAAAAGYPARNLALHQADARALPFPIAAFDFALAGGNGSFNHLDGAGALAALTELRRMLRPGGGLGLELVNPYLLAEIDPERTFGPLRPTPPGVSLERTVRNRHDLEADLFHIQQVTRFELDDEGGEFAESFTLHVWAPAQVQEMLEQAGFGDIQLYGSYAQVPFDRWSADLLVVARHRERSRIVGPTARDEPKSLTSQ